MLFTYEYSSSDVSAVLEVYVPVGGSEMYVSSGTSVSTVPSSSSTELYMSIISSRKDWHEAVIKRTDSDNNAAIKPLTNL